MIHELVYTSAPRGLTPGVKGFCTVESTAGITPSLAERLESLSGYRHLFAAHDENARLNPVIFSHLKAKLGSSVWHVLSRICDAGLDYSQRSNKLAHHVALDASALAPAGPAWLLAQAGFMKTNWAGEPQTVPADRKLPAGNPPPTVCQAWQVLSGDAGWAGVLAETALQGSDRQAAIIFRPGMNTLPLVCEAISLLPPERRWDVTFSTFFNKLPPGVECQWRFLVEGEAEANAALKNPRMLVLNLCQPLDRVPDGELVEAARSGKVVHRPAAQSAGFKLASAPRPPAGAAPQTARADATGGVRQARPSATSPAARRPLRAPAKKPVSKAAIAVGVVALFGCIGVGTFFIGAGASQVAVAPPPPPATEEELQTMRVEPKIEPTAALEQPTRERRHRRSEPKEEQPAAPIVVATTAMPEPVAKSTVPARDPFEDLKRLKKSPGYLDLPGLPYSNAPPGMVSAASSGALVKLYLLPEAIVKLELQAPVANSVKIEATFTPREWKVEAITGSIAGNNLLGTFNVLKDGQLKFEWNSRLSPAMQPQRLAYCRLAVHVGDESETIPLRRPRKLEIEEPLHLASDTPDTAVLELSPYSKNANIGVQLVAQEKGAVFKKLGMFVMGNELSSACDRFDIPPNKKTSVVMFASSANMMDIKLDIEVKADGQVSVTKGMLPPGVDPTKPGRTSPLSKTAESRAQAGLGLRNAQLRQNKGDDNPRLAEEVSKFGDWEQRYANLSELLEAEKQAGPLLKVRFYLPKDD